MGEAELFVDMASRIKALEEKIKNLTQPIPESFYVMSINDLVDAVNRIEARLDKP